jgi:hypothetical protein
MPNSYIKDGGVQRLIQRPFAKVSGAWQPIKKIWVKDTGTWRQVFGNTGSQTFSAVGSTSWTPPPGVYSVDVTYPSTSGLVTSSLSVTPGIAVSISVGDYGSSSTFGSVTAPAYDKAVFAFQGNVDAQLTQQVQVATTTATSYSGSGNNSTITSGATANGIYYNVSYEGWHGDLGAGVQINPVLISTLLTTFECYFSYHAGREANNVIDTQPSASNSYRLGVSQYDGNRSEGYYENTLNLRQKGYFSITY